MNKVEGAAEIFTPLGSSVSSRAKYRAPRIRLYTYFEAIAFHGSIRSAAEALKIASSALNRRLLDLEDEIGVPLFDRLQRGVRLTAAGELFAAHVRRTLRDAEDLSDQLHALEGLGRSRVAIGSAESAAVELLPEAMASFQRMHPGVRFTLMVGTPQALLDELIEDRVDFILTHQEPSRPDVMVLAAPEKPFCALMRRDHPLAGLTHLTLPDCQDYPLVLANEQMAARALIDAALASSPVRMQPVLETNMFEVMKHYVRRTDAISFQFHFGADRGEHPDGLAAIPLSDAQLVRPRLILAVRRGRDLPVSATAMCAHLRALLEAL
jgi:DNA-binding transcriptional LysR family regulator